MTSDDPSPQPARRSGLRSPRFLLTTVLLLAAGLAFALLPIPWLVFSPSAPRPIDAMIRLDGAPRDLSGELLASSAGFRKATPALALWALLDSSRDIIRDHDYSRVRPVTGAGGSLEESITVATVVGLDLAGYDASVTSEGLQVTSVAPEDPVAQLLGPGDILLEADGQPLVLPSDLVGLAAGAAPGDTIEILRLRDGREELIDAPIHVDGLRSHVEVTTVPIDPVRRLPPGVAIQALDLEAVGSSAGLVLALAIHDRFADEPLIAGRMVTGTGTIDRFGGVHPILGIEQKVLAAEDAGVSLFLVPERLHDEAVAASSGSMQIIPVATVREAIEALRGMQ